MRSTVLFFLCFCVLFHLTNVDGTIVDADISGTAAITPSKLGTGALPTTVTIVSANIVNDTIVDANINSAAAIVAISTQAAPAISLFIAVITS